jgi:hypothetical protein
VSFDAPRSGHRDGGTGRSGRLAAHREGSSSVEAADLPLSGVADAQLRMEVLEVHGCLRLSQGADDWRRCRDGCRQGYRPTFRFRGGYQLRTADAKRLGP